MFSQNEQAQLVVKLETYHDSTSNEFAVVVESSLNGMAAFDRSLEIAEEWGIGNEKKDNGLLIYVAVKEHEIFIQVGQGLEGNITDGRAERVIRNVITPLFEQGRYYDGIDQGISKLIEYAAGEFEGSGDVVAPPMWLIVSIIILIILMIFIFGKGGQTYTGKRHSSRGPWGWGGGGWSSGGGFGSGGGGFGGFGGGSFGGGGAGGSWR